MTKDKDSHYKVLFHMTEDHGGIQVDLRISKRTDSIGFYTSFGQWDKTKFKTLNRMVIEGAEFTTGCVINERTGHIGINTGFDIMGIGKSCGNESGTYLGVNIAEHVLSKIYPNVKVMPYGNPGFDFKCGKGYLVDVKSSCSKMTNAKISQKYWFFNIERNIIADYFLCLGFDNRKDLNPIKIWLIPGHKVNDKIGITIQENTTKWIEYEQDIDKVTECCNHLKH